MRDAFNKELFRAMWSVHPILKEIRVRPQTEGKDASYGDAEAIEIDNLKKIKRKQKSEDDLLQLVPLAPLEIFRPDLIQKATQHGMGQNKAKSFVAILIEKGVLEVAKKPRSGTKPAEFLRRAA